MWDSSSVQLKQTKNIHGDNNWISLIIIYLFEDETIQSLELLNDISFSCELIKVENKVTMKER